MRVTVEYEDTKEQYEFNACVIIGVKPEGDALQCTLLTNTDIIEQDATEKTELLHGMEQMREKIINSNVLMKLANKLDPNFVNTFCQASRTYTPEEWVQRQAAAKIFHEAMGDEEE